MSPFSRSTSSRMRIDLRCSSMNFSRSTPLGKSSLIGLLLLVGFDVYAGSSVDLAWERCSPLPERIGFVGGFCGVSEGVLIVAGGANSPALPPWEGGRKV